MDINYDTVLNAIYKQLQKLYPEYTVYKNLISNPEYPDFFINQISVVPIPDTKNFWWLDYLFAIEYRHAEDLTIAMNLEETLDEVGFNLNENLWYLEDIKTWIKDPSINKGEGVLSFTFNVRIRVRKEELEELMRTLTINDKENQTEV
jgi:hypothetical protein|nr:MAG TPA: tail completion protein [Caudoviricetes sp.]